MRGIAIQSAGGFINISGLDNNEKIDFFAVDGKALGSAKSIEGSVSFSAKQGTVVVAKIGKGEREDSSGIISFIIMLSTPARRGPCGDFFIFPLYGE